MLYMYRECCEQMENFIEKEVSVREMDPDKMVHYDEVFDEYGLKIYDGGSSVIRISHCPWCGQVLPKSKRYAWFDEVENMGYEDPRGDDAEKIPNEYKTSEWWKRKEKQADK